LRLEAKVKRITLTLAMVLIPALTSAQGQDAASKKEKVVDTKFMFVATLLGDATVFDLESTYRAINNGAREGNVLMKPFINHGRPVAYAFSGAVDTGVIFLAYKMKKSQNPDERKMWWLIPVAFTAGHAIAGGFNLRFTINMK
jgi:hypothetical protein